MSTNTVKVISIDEERLKFRVIVNFDAPGIAQNAGRYQFQLPPPTSFANSDQYSACTIQCDGFVGLITSAIGDPTWTVAGGLVKLGAIEIRMNIGSSQSVLNQSLIPAFSGVGDNRQGGYRQMLSLQLKFVGDNTGVVVPGARSGAWEGRGLGDPMLCANPFGQNVAVTLNDIMTDSPCYLVSAAAGAASADLGQYAMQFTITMIRNN